MSEDGSFPSLPATYAKARHIAAKRRGYWAYLPVNLILSGLVTGATYVFTPAEFWLSTNKSNVITVYSAILAFAGILLALGWSAFTKNFDILGRGHLGEFLKKNEILDVHLMYISLTNFSLTLFAIMTFVGLMTLVIGVPILVMQIVFSLMIGCAFNAVTKAFDLNRFTQELIWDDINAS